MWNNNNVCEVSILDPFHSHITPSCAATRCCFSHTILNKVRGDEEGWFLRHHTANPVSQNTTAPVHPYLRSLFYNSQQKNILAHVSWELLNAIWKLSKIYWNCLNLVVWVFNVAVLSKIIFDWYLLNFHMKRLNGKHAVIRTPRVNV